MYGRNNQNQARQQRNQTTQRFGQRGEKLWQNQQDHQYVGQGENTYTPESEGEDESNYRNQFVDSHQDGQYQSTQNQNNSESQNWNFQNQGSQDYRRHEQEYRAHPALKSRNYAQKQIQNRPLNSGNNYGRQPKDYHPENSNGSGPNPYGSYGQGGYGVGNYTSGSYSNGSQRNVHGFEKNQRSDQAVTYGDSSSRGFAGSYDQSSDNPYTSSLKYGTQSPEVSHAGKGPKGYRRSDERIKEDANEHLTHDHHVDAGEIEVSVENGVITLSGTVEDRQMKRMAEDCVEGINGVIDVKNDLKVESKSPEAKVTQEKDSSQNKTGKNQTSGSSKSLM
jgi:hypothetical protein